jgi:hypothetical protein
LGLLHTAGWGMVVEETSSTYQEKNPKPSADRPAYYQLRYNGLKYEVFKLNIQKAKYNPYISHTIVYATYSDYVGTQLS